MRYNTNAGRARPASTQRLIATKADLLAPSFVAVDFETANRQGGVSACQIAAVRVDDGEVSDRFVTFLRPPVGWDSFEFTYLHGISAADVCTAPMWSDIADDLAQFVGGRPTFAHNSSFDCKVWHDLDDHFGTSTCPEKFYCTYRTTKRLIPGWENYKLPTVVAKLVHDYDLNHHEAESDAEACARIVCALQKLPESLTLE